VDLPDLNENMPPPSRESHLEFFWLPVNVLEKHSLQPYPFQKLIPQLAEGDETVWWTSTLHEPLQ
jgi:8-oxo-dGTP diphosphatase